LLKLAKGTASRWEGSDLGKGAKKANAENPSVERKKKTKNRHRGKRFLRKQGHKKNHDSKRKPLLSRPKKGSAGGGGGGGGVGGGGGGGFGQIWLTLCPRRGSVWAPP